MAYRILILLALCLVLSGCGGSDQPKPINRDAWKRVDCPPQRPGEYCWLEGHASEVRALAFSLDGRLLASASYNGVVRIWDLSKMQQLSPFTIYKDATCSYENYSRECTQLFFTEDEKLVFTAITSFLTERQVSVGGTFTTMPEYITYPIFFWDTKQQKLDGRLEDCHTRATSRFAVSANGRYLSSECLNRELGKPEEYWDERGKSITNVCYIPGNLQPRSPESDKFLVVWDTATKQPLRQFQAGLCGKPTDDLLDFAFRGTEILAGTAGGEVWIWDFATQKDGEPPVKKIKALGDGIEVIASSVAFSPDGKKVAIANANVAKVYEVDSGKELARLTISQRYYDAWLILFSPDGKYLASLDTGNNFRVWNLVSGELLIEDASSPIDFLNNAVSFSPDGRLIAVNHGAVIALLRLR